MYSSISHSYRIIQTSLSIWSISTW